MKKFNKIIILLVTLVIGIYYIYVSQNSYSIKNVSNEITGIKVRFIDVGQADSILIETSNQKMLIDAGNIEDGKKLVNYFKDLGINEFNYVIGTHAHEDHIGGMSDIINNFKVDRFLMPDVITTTKTFEDTLDALNSKSIKFETPSIGDTYSMDDAIIKVVYVGTDEDNLNNDSIVLKMNYKNIKFLFMGDATTSVEKEIMNDDLKADILKVGHHGSNTSTSSDFLKKVKPSYAIVSVGLNNTYNLPSSKIVDRLKKQNISVYRTDESGTINVTSDGDNINIETVKTDTNG
jgi:competence protein ComEC